MASDVKKYDAFTGKWVAATDEEAAHAKAVAKGGKLPSDRTQDELDRLEPAFAGPVLTTGTPAASEASAAPGGAGAGAAAGRAATGGGNRAT